MNLLQNSKGCFIATSEEQPFDSPVPPSVLMKADEASAEPPQPVPPTAHHDARRLVRFIQCPQCSKPFMAPVTLPCGNTICKACLPPPQQRANISYPNTLDRQAGYACPFPACGTLHPTVECSQDVTLTKVMDIIRIEIGKHTGLAGGKLIQLEEIPCVDEDLMVVEEEKRQPGHQRALPAGRLVAAFMMAEMGELHYTSELIYHSSSTAGDDHQDLDLQLLERARDVTQKEVDCLVCYNMMLDPTTTPCGHTFCRRCLTRVLDHANICPICRRNLPIPPSLQNHPSNTTLVAILDGLCPDLVAARSQALNLEEQAGEATLDTPLFVCTLALPTMPTFLHIFEPRYRLMMRRCVEGNRQFGMIMYNRACEPQGDLGATTFLEYGTLLEIINFELLRDGRSFVECRGIGRFKVRDHGMLDGYYVGRVERVEDVSLTEEEHLEAEETRAALVVVEEHNRQNPPTPLDPEVALSTMSTQELLTRCISFIERMRAHSAPWLSARIISVYGGPPNDPATFPYWFASVLPIAEEEKYILLRTTRVRERLKLVNSWIRRIEGQRWPQGSACSIL
ncbi:PUA-like domain-containing protein [Lophiotrema nucula]|uniref:PUA-like domain-containing protein n=1 Tax=Lophiotrema nucula TaxID=690887 RepID=A0A6A5Z8W1_9PLEO|nr:PUA-like domain-containing protein [Lophiotrema nucula]